MPDQQNPSPAPAVPVVKESLAAMLARAAHTDPPRISPAPQPRARRLCRTARRCAATRLVARRSSRAPARSGLLILPLYRVAVAAACRVNRTYRLADLYLRGYTTQEHPGR